MKLYHGTSWSNLDKILKEGIQPRGERPSTWDMESRSDLVYLTDSAYALYFAMNACADDDEMVILEIELPNDDNLLPDEDFLEQGTRSNRAPTLCPYEGPDKMEEATAWFRDNLEDFWHLRAHSVKHMGTCAHKGVIWPEWIKRYAIVSDRSFCFIFDPTITILNYQIMGPYYRNGARWFFDPEAEFEPDTVAGDSSRIREASRQDIEVHTVK